MYHNCFVASLFCLLISDLERLCSFHESLLAVENYCYYLVWINAKIPEGSKIQVKFSSRYIIVICILQLSQHNSMITSDIFTPEQGGHLGWKPIRSMLLPLVFSTLDSVFHLLDLVVALSHCPAVGFLYLRCLINPSNPLIYIVVVQRILLAPPCIICSLFHPLSHCCSNMLN